MKKPSSTVIAQISAVGDGFRKDLPVVLEGKVGDQDLITLITKKADHNDQYDRRGEKDEEHSCKRQRP